MSATLTAPETKQRWPRWLRLVRLAALLYLGVVLVFLFLENSLLFYPIRATHDWMPKPSPQIQDVEFRTADGTLIHGWWLPRPRAQSALIYAHGNAGNLSHRGSALPPLAEALDVSVLIFDYPGYGHSQGKPGEQACYASGDAAYDWVTQTQGIQPENVILYGKSLGGGVMTELATRRPHRALVLVKTFTSVPNLAQELYPFLPARWLVRNRFDNLAKIGHCNRPIFIAHGDCDSLIPLHHGERLFAAAHEPKEFLVMPGCDHNDPHSRDFLPRLRRFLDRHAPISPEVPAATPTK
jgi:hypothetical protein